MHADPYGGTARMSMRVAGDRAEADSGRRGIFRPASGAGDLDLSLPLPLQ